MGSTHASILAWEIPRATEDEIIGWHHQLNGHESEQTQGDSEGQESLVCCSPWGHKELDMTVIQTSVSRCFLLFELLLTIS